MKITYKRSPNQSFMIMEGTLRPPGFETEMLRENNIPVLLGFYTMEYNGNTQFWYDISGKRSLRDYTEQEGITAESLKLVFEYIGMAYYHLDQYLIGEENIYLHPDTIYFEKKKTDQKIFLTYCPVEHDDFRLQLRELMNFYISEADQRQMEVARLCRELFALIESEGFSFTELLKKLREECDGIGEDEGYREYTEPEKIEQPKVFSEDIKKESEADEITPKQKKDKRKGLFLARFSELFQKKTKGKQEEILPEDVQLADVCFDEVEDSEGTQFLSEDKLYFGGMLKYEGNDDESDYTISHTPFLIGSKEGGNDAVLHSKVVSRYHAKIVRRGKCFYLEDLNSQNGTYLNGEMIPYHEETPIKPGDVISFADVIYRMV